MFSVTPSMLRLYHRLPPPLQGVVASARGYRLRSWRYDRRTDALVQEALDREGWSADRWKSYRQELLARVLHRAATLVPFYRAHWAQRRRRGDQRSSEILDNWPILDKETLRSRPLEFVADDCDVRRMFKDHTSGTTGKSLDLWFSRDTVLAWYALFEARARRWYGVSRHDRWAIIGGQLVAPVGRTSPPFWVWNAGLKQLYMSAWHLSPRFLPAYFEALEKYEIRYVLGYSSAINTLGLAARDISWPNKGQLRVAITNAEPLPRDQREPIESGLGCPVRETYGMAELVAVASECGEHRLHLWPEVGWLEVLDGTTPANPGEPGDLVCTGLLNHDMPLIRYQVGDRAVLAPDSERCTCGRQLPLLRSIEGRSDDLILTRDGRRIGQLESIFRFNVPVREAQVIQESLGRLRNRYAPDADFTEEHESLIRERVRLRLGDIETILERVDRVERAPNGKIRYVICQLTPAERQAAQSVHA